MTDPVTAAVVVAASAPAVAAASPGFFATAFGFTLGAITAWGIAILAVLFVLGILFEHNGARGWSVFSALVTAAVAYFFFTGVSLGAIAVGSVAYIAIGLVWSFWRYKRHAAAIVERYKGSSPREREVALARLHPKAMLDTILAWVLIWPFSFIENMIGDFITAIQSLITKVFRGVYHRIYDSAVKSLS
jgi:hypothetical protein